MAAVKDWDAELGYLDKIDQLSNELRVAKTTIANNEQEVATSGYSSLLDRTQRALVEVCCSTS